MNKNFISIEGIDGAGKSSHLEWMKNHIESITNTEVLTTREPGGTPLGEALRVLLLKVPMNLVTETMLMFAARNEHCLNVIIPALKDNKIVISDRFTDSTYAFQYGGRGLNIETIEVIEKLTIGNFEPALTFLFDVPTDIAKDRIGERDLDRFELEKADFHQRVRGAYLARQLLNPERIILIDSTKTIEDIRIDLKNHLDYYFSK